MLNLTGRQNRAQLAPGRGVVGAMTFQHTVLHDDHILSRCLRDDHGCCEFLGENSSPHTKHGDFYDNGVELSHPESESKS